MALYLITRRPARVGHDEYDSFVVRAHGSREARVVAAKQFMSAADRAADQEQHLEELRQRHMAEEWLDPQKSTCTAINTTAAQSRIIHASFRFG